MLSSNLTVCLFAFNEERRIEQGLSNFEGLARILVVDNCSTDRTAEIASTHGCDVIEVRNPGFIETPEVMDVVQAAVSTPYLLIASCAEVVPAALLRLYADVAQSGSHDVVQALRVSITAGREVPVSAPPRIAAYDTRFFRKGSVDYVGNRVHQVGRVTARQSRVLRVDRHDADRRFYQFRDYDASKTEDALRRYGDVLAVQRHEAGERFGVTRCLFRSVGHFLNAYLRFGCYRFGMLGFLHAAYRGIMEFTIQLRLWELQSGCTLPWVIDQNRRSKADMLATLDTLRAETSRRATDPGSPGLTPNP